MEISKNVKMMSKGGKLIPVPYDFDFSKMVNAQYANTDFNYNSRILKAKELTEMSKESKDFNNSIELFKRKKSEIIQLVQDFKLINKPDRRRIIELINLFYQELDMEI
jgi:hypothetical protein